MTAFIFTEIKPSNSSVFRDAISKALYSRLFTWLVERINLIVCRSERDRSTSLAVLDIFGFEVRVVFLTA